MAEIVKLSNGAMIDLDTLPPEEQRAHRLAIGCRVEWAATPALNATYAVDEGALAGLELAARAPSPSVGWPDIAGHGRIFTKAQLVRLGAALHAYRQGVILAALARDVSAGADVPWPARLSTIA